MKKKYIKPEMTVEVMEVQEMISTSLPQGEGTGEPWANGYRGFSSDNRRGEWGNLWSEGEQTSSSWY